MHNSAATAWGLRPNKHNNTQSQSAFFCGWIHHNGHAWNTLISSFSPEDAQGLSDAHSLRPSQSYIKQSDSPCLAPDVMKVSDSLVCSTCELLVHHQENVRVRVDQITCKITTSQTHKTVYKGKRVVTTRQFTRQCNS